jgi:hypothetical protein
VTAKSLPDMLSALATASVAAPAAQNRASTTASAGTASVSIAALGRAGPGPTAAAKGGRDATRPHTPGSAHGRGFVFFPLLAKFDQVGPAVGRQQIASSSSGTGNGSFGFHRQI